MKRPEAPGRGAAAGRPRPMGGLRRLLWSVPLGWQLSALYTLLLAATLALVGVLVYTQQQTFLVQDAAARLEQAATAVVTHPLVVDGRGGPAGFGGDRGSGPNPSGTSGFGPGGAGALTPAEDPFQLQEDLVRNLSGRDVTVTVRDLQGAVLTTTQGLTSASAPIVDPVTAQQIATARVSPAPAYWIARRADGSRQVVVLMPVTRRPLDPAAPGAGAGTTLLLEQSASLAAADTALVRLGTYLLLGVLGGTLVGVLVGITFTRAVLRPLDQVADTAEAIAAGDLQRRLLLPPGRNEVARLGKTFDEMVGRLVATLEAQRRFVADASHELRTPLTSMKGLTEILMIGAHGDDSRVIEQSAGAIHEEIDRLSRLVNGLLTLSRLDSMGGAETPTARRAPLDVCTTLRAAADQMSALAEMREVRLSATCSAPLRIVGDAGQIKQVLLNLLDNALRYTPAGGEVAVHGTIDGPAVRIEVRDTGSGIAPQDLPHIFERFYRGDASRTRATGNSGLGLAIVKSIVEAHNGEIAVRSTPGAGTCFTIRLPLAPGRVAEEAPVPAAAAH